VCSTDLTIRASAAVHRTMRALTHDKAHMRTRNWRARATRVVLVLGTVSLAAGCASTTRIGKLLAEPQHYDGKSVQVSGHVTRGSGFLGIGAYEIDDGTGRIVVIARGQGVPADGANTRVKGTFQSLFSIGGRTIAAILQGDGGGR
jgi:hypothetical protein